MIHTVSKRHPPDGATAPDAFAVDPQPDITPIAARFRRAMERSGGAGSRVEDGIPDHLPGVPAFLAGSIAGAESGHRSPKETIETAVAARTTAWGAAGEHESRREADTSAVGLSAAGDEFGPERRKAAREGAETSRDKGDFPRPEPSPPRGKPPDAEAVVSGEHGSKASLPPGWRRAPTHGEVILAGWQGAAPAGKAAGPVPDRNGKPVGTDPARGEALARLGERLAERIAATAPARAGAAEVRISLKDAVLPGTEIRLRHEHDRLVVAFVTDNAGAERTLGPRLDDLRRTLEQRFPGGVEVSVARSDGGGQAGGDGRSRGRRDAYEEWAVRNGKESGGRTP